MDKRISNAIDEMNAELPELNTFIMPIGSEMAAALHHCRTVARRTERVAVRFCDLLPEAERTREIFAIMAYLNRLSDFLFVLARMANHIEGIKDADY